MNKHPSIDYLVVGHLSEDRTPRGPSLGGTAAYASLTAAALGHSVGVVTSASDSLDLSPLDHLSVERVPAAQSTSFENRYSASGRTQRLLSRAEDLELKDVPQAWREPQIVHLGPIAREIDLKLATAFPDSFVGLTPQGWLRNWDSSGRVFFESWDTAVEYLQLADAVVLSKEDLAMQQSAAEAMAPHCKLLVITEAAAGARVHSGGHWTELPAPSSKEHDPTGAGDIFAAVFFSEMRRSGNALAAAQMANLVASASVAREGLKGTRAASEIHLAPGSVGE